MARSKAVFVCSECGQQVAQWVGRCPGCSAWGTIAERSAGTPGAGRGGPVLPLLGVDPVDHPTVVRVPTGIEGVDRVLGGGLVPATVALLAGEPGIGKSTLLLQLVASLAGSGKACLVASGEESREQVAMRAARLGLPADRISFVPGRELGDVLAAAADVRPFLVAVDSVQALRDGSLGSAAGGPAQVRACADALVGFAKAHGVAVLMTGHVTKDGDVAGPRTLEHAVDVVLAFDGDPRSGLRMLSSGKNRFGAEGEIVWFEMRADGLAPIDPSKLLLSGDGQPGAAVALPRAGRRALAVELQALVVPGEGPGRRQATGLDPRRFQLVAAVLDRVLGIPLARAELFGAAAGGVRVDDPACDLAVAASLVSAATGAPAPPGSAFVGELTLTGLVRAVPGTTQRLGAARAAGLRRVVAAETASVEGVRVTPVRDVTDALAWAFRGASAARSERRARSA